MADLLEVNGVDPSGLLRYKEYAKPETVKQYQRSANRQAIETTLSTPAEYNTGHFFNGTSSMFDEGMGVSNLENIQDWRANEQPGYMKAAAAIVHGATAAGSTILESNPYVLGFAALSSVESDESSIVDKLLRNPVFSAIGKLSEGINQATPIYQTKESQAEQENSVAANLFSYQGLDNLLTGIGFLAGAQAGAKGIYEALGEGKGAANYLKKLALGEKGVALNETDAAWGALADKIGKFGAESSSTLLARIPESYMEADQTYKQGLAEGLTEDQAKDAMHKNFMFNMALSSMDLFQNIKIFKTFEKSAGELEQAAARAVKSGKVFTTARKLGYTGLKALEGIPFEQEEEGLQYSSDIAARESAKYGADFMSTFKDEYGKSWTDTQGQVSRIMGGLMGAGGAAFASKGNTKKIDELAGQYKQMLQQQTLNNNENAITSNNVYTTIQDENGNSTQVVNKAFVDNANTFTKLEGIKQVALQNQDKDLYDYASELQLMNKGLAHLQTGTYDDFIDDLKLTEQDDQQDPTNKALIGSETADEKIKKLEDLKKVYNHINANSEFSNLTQDSKMPIYKNIIDQKTAFKTLIKIKPKLETLQLENKTAAGVLGIKEEDIKENEFEYLDPVQQAEGKRLSEQVPQLEKLNNTLKKEYQDFKTKERVTNDDKSEDFKDTNKIFIPYVENIVKDQEEEKAIVKAIDDLKAEGQPVEVVNADGDIIMGTLEDDGTFVDTEGNPTEISAEEVAKQMIAKKNEDKKREGEKHGVEQDDDSNVDEIEQSNNDYKKSTQLSTSLNWHIFTDGVKQVLIKVKDKIRESIFKTPTENLEYLTYIAAPEHSVGIVKGNTTVPPIITFKAERGTVSDAQRQTTNDTRKRRNGKGYMAQHQLDMLTEAMMNHPDYVPIKLVMYVNGRRMAGYESYFHDRDYFFETSEYEKMVNDVKEKISKDPENEKTFIKTFKEAVQEKLNAQSKIREQLLKDMQEGDVFLEVENKSEGLVNYNPKVEKDGKKVRQVNPFKNVAGWSMKTLLPGFSGYSVVQPPVAGAKNGKIKAINTKGIGIALQREEGQKQTRIQFTDGTFLSTDTPYPAGTIILHTVAANGNTVFITPFEKSKFSNEQLSDIANLIMYKIKGGDKITINGKETDVFVGDGNGLIDALIYTGQAKNNRDSQLIINKNGILLGEKHFQTPTTPEEEATLLIKIKGHLAAYKSKPQYKIKSQQQFGNNFSLPKIVDGKVTETKTSSYHDFLFQGNTPLIGTNVNSEFPFVSSYYTFKMDNGKLATTIKGEKKVEPTTNDIISDKDYNNFINNGKVSNEILESIANKVKYREKLSDRETSIFSDKTSEINQIIKDSQPVSGIEAKRGDIEKRRQEELNKKYKVSLGKESEYKDAYYKGSTVGATLKQFEVLDENGQNIGKVVIEIAKDKSIILHPELISVGKGYGQELYKLISSKYNTAVTEWTHPGVSKTEAAKKLWSSLEKQGLTTPFEFDEGRYARSLNINQLINAKYDAELAALETPKTEVSNKVEDTSVPEEVKEIDKNVVEQAEDKVDECEGKNLTNESVKNTWKKVTGK